MQPRFKKRIALLLCILLTAVLSAGCVALPAPAQEPGPEAQASPSPSAQPEETAKPTPTPTPTPLVVTSDYLIPEPKRKTDTPMGPKDTWTIFIYMCGTDLETREKEATKNLNELMGVEFSDSVNVIVQTGGTREWHTPGIDPSLLQRFLVRDGEMTLLTERRLASMGDQDSLYDFLLWGVQTYPADKMGVIFWNHGGGSMKGTEYDQLFDRDALTLPEMENAFAGAAESMTDKFEFVGFDTCLMATLETANALAHYARYLIASEETEPGGGWNYGGWAQYLSDTPRATGADVGRVICDNFLVKSRDAGEGDMVTLSVTDLSRLNNVLYALNNVAKDLNTGVDDPSFFASVSRGARRAESYGGNTSQEGFTNLIDVGDMVLNIEEVVPESAKILLQALDEAVVYSVNGPSREYANGLSVFYPLAVSEGDDETYARIAATPAYGNYVKNLIESRNTVVQSGEDIINILQDPYISADGYYEMQIDPQSMHNVQGVYFDIFQLSEDGATMVYLGSDSDLNVDWETGLVGDNFSGSWAVLAGQPVALYIMEERAEYNLYSSPVLLNGEETNLRVKWIWKDGGDGYFEIMGTWGGIDPETGMAAREIRELKPGDSIVPLYLTLDAEAYDELPQTEGKTIRVTSGLKLEFSPLSAGYYLYGFAVRDVYGDYYTTDTVGFELDGSGGITIDGGVEDMEGSFEEEDLYEDEYIDDEGYVEGEEDYWDDGDVYWEGEDEYWEGEEEYWDEGEYVG